MDGSSLLLRYNDQNVPRFAGYFFWHFCTVMNLLVEVFSCRITIFMRMFLHSAMPMILAGRRARRCVILNRIYRPGLRRTPCSSCCYNIL